MGKILMRIFNGVKRGVVWFITLEHLPHESPSVTQKQPSLPAWFFTPDKLESAPPVRKDPDRRNFFAWLASPQKLEEKPEREREKTNFLKWIFKGESL